MKLYDIFYFGNSMDSNVALPDCGVARKNCVRYAVCTNMEREYLIPTRDGWITVTESEALAR